MVALFFNLCAFASVNAYPHQLKKCFVLSWLPLLTQYMLIIQVSLKPITYFKLLNSTKHLCENLRCACSDQCGTHPPYCSFISPSFTTFPSFQAIRLAVDNMYSKPLSCFEYISKNYL
uniref:Putative secreted protein n=1 Tax=Ixodes ricinus TaxID=34613 RepID=A0A6B0ULU5_IXORI